MRMKSPMLFVLVMVTGLFFITGCEESTTSPALEGEPDDSGYEAMSELNELGFETMKIAFDLSDTVMAMGGASSPLFKAHKVNAEILNFHSLEYAYNNFWHIFTFTAVMAVTEEGQTDSMQVSGVDSLRFKKSGNIVQYPDEFLTDEMNIRQHVSINAFGADGTVMQVIDHAVINVTAESFSDDIITLDGAMNDTLVVSSEDFGDQIMGCDMELTSTQTYNHLVIDDTQDCPTGGTIGMSAAFSIDCMTDDGSVLVESIWIATYTFNNGMLSTDIYSGGQHWQSDAICGGI